MQGHDLIKKERKRQKASAGEHFSAAHDNKHVNQELLFAAHVYLAHAIYGNSSNGSVAVWPWEKHWLKPGDKRKNLIKAGALIAAELDRMKRAGEFVGSEDPGFD